MTLWLYLHFPQLQLDTLFGDDSLPVAIVNSHTSKIVQCNELATKEGINLGMGLGSAAALCHGLQVHPYEEKCEQQRLRDIAQWLYLVTADISFYQPNGLLIKVSDMLSLYPSLSRYWQVLDSHLTQLDIHYDYACGYSPYAARLLARAGFNCVSDDKVTLENALASNALTMTELGDKEVHNLHRVGLRLVSDLLQLPLAELGKRFGVELVTYIGKLTGQLRHPVEYFHPPEQFSQYVELLFDIDKVEWLKKSLLKIYQRLETFLLLRNKHAKDLTITLYLRDHPEQVVSIGAGQGEYKADKWLALSHLTFESLILNAPVTGLTVTARQLVNNDIEKVDLFLGKQGDVSSSELVALLQAKLGENQVKGIKINADLRPELSSQHCPPLVEHKETTTTSVLQPSFLLPEPEPLQEKVSIEQGPERIISGWWDDKEVHRDYFIARSEQGRWLWIFRTIEQKWFVHGLFS